MKDQIRSLFSILEKDPHNEETITGLEEIVTSDVSDNDREVISTMLTEGRKGLERAGQYEAVCKVIDLELALVNDRGLEVELLKKQGDIYEEELFDQKSALALYQKALALLPDDEELEMKIEAVTAERENWKQIVDKFIEQAEGEVESSLKGHMYYSAAERIYKNHKRGKDVPTYLDAALKADPTHLKAARLLEKVLRERGKFDELADMYTNLAEHRRTKAERIQMLLASAHVYESKLEDGELAAVQYSQILDLDPGHSVALKYLVKHYEASQDWDHLVSVYEDALAGNISKEDEIAILMQAGMVYWRMQGSMEKAEKFFKRLKRLDPAHAGMINFYRAYMRDREDKTELLQVLTDAQRVTGNPEAAYKLTNEIAQLAAEDGGNVERAIDAFKEVLRQEPDNDDARQELKRLYRQGEKWNALLDLLKMEIESLPPDAVPEKTEIYSEIAGIYRDHLSLGTMVIKSYKSILDIDPTNAEAQAALSETYEKEGRWNDLINLYTKQIKSMEDPGSKVPLLNKVAKLWIEKFNNFNRAVDPLEEIIAIDPSNRIANRALRMVYEKRRAWRQLVGLLKNELDSLEGDEKLAQLVEMAELTADRLSDHQEAIQIWRQVLEMDPRHEQALTSLEKLTERSKDWEGLCDMLDLRIDMTEDPNEQISLLTKMGTILKDRVKDPGRSAEAWRRILEINPNHAKSIRSLKEAYLGGEDWESLEKLYVDAEDYEGLVEVLGIAADRTVDSDTKVKLSFRCAEIYEDPIGQPDRALRHFERVLSVDPENQRAASALVPIYKRGEKWSRLIGVTEVLLGHATSQIERALLMDEMREIAAEHMNNRALAFDWAARAFAESPLDEGIRERLEEAAENANKFSELVALYRTHMDAFEGEVRLRMERHVAQLALDRLGLVEEAVESYQSILERDPGDEESLQALDEIFRSAARWKELVGIYDRRIDLTEDVDSKRHLQIEVADLFEQGLDDLERARARYRAILELVPGDRGALASLERIARLNENWEELSEILSEQRNAPNLAESEWRNITSQLAALFDLRLEDSNSAVGLYEEILERFPGDEETIHSMEHFLREDEHRTRVARLLEPHLVQVQNWRVLAWVLAILIEATEDAEKRLALQHRLADVYGEKLDDGNLAFETLGAALKERPDNKDLWDRMTAMATNQDRLSDLAERFEDAYTSGKLDAVSEFELALRLADLLEVQLGRSADAAPYHARVFESDPAASGSFVALETLYTSESRWDDLISLYRRALDGGAAVESALELQLKICFVYEEIKHNAPLAIQAYRDVLDMDPQNVQATRALTILYEEVEDWPSLSDLLISQLSVTEAEEAVNIRYRLGEIYEQYLDRKSDALDYYEQVLAEDPNHLHAQEALERFLELEALQFRAARILENTYENQGAAEQLARVLMISLNEEGLDADEKISILTRVADLRERRLGDVNGAFDVLSLAFTLDPSQPMLLSELERVSEQNGLSQQYAAKLDRVIPDVLDNRNLAAKLISTVARIYDEVLFDYTKAEQAYRQLLNLDHDNPETALPAIAALERMLSANESFEPLLEVLRIKSRLVESFDEQKAILYQMAEIEETVLSRPENAISLFKEILDQSDNDLPALLGLERLYEQKQEWLDLVDILVRRAEIAEDSAERRDLLFRVAVLYEKELEDTEEAIAAYTQVNEAAGADRDSLAALTRLYERSERWPELLEVYEIEESIIEDPEERVALYSRMGNLLRLKLEDPERAVSVFGKTLSIDPGHREARESLEVMLDSKVRLEAIELLKPIYEAEANFEKLLRCDEIVAEETDDPYDRAEVLAHAATVAEDGLGDAARAFQILGRAFRHGATSPDLAGSIVSDLERLSQQVGGSETLVNLYREVTPDIMDGQLQIHCYLRVADIAFTQLNDNALARDYFVKVLDIDGENLTAMSSLEVIYETEGQFVDLLEIYRRKVQTVEDDTTRIDILFKQAQVCEEKLEDMSSAITTYETILDMDNFDAKAMAALERLYPKAERWTDLMNLLEVRAEQETEDRAELLYRLGFLAEERLGDDERALDYYARVLDVAPDHQETLSSLEAALEDEARRGRVAAILEPVYNRMGEWKKLVGALEARLEYCDDLEERKELLRQMGTRYEEQLGDLESAFSTFARLFKEDIEDESSREVLTRLASVLEIWPRLAEVYAEVLDDVVGDTPTTAHLSYILGDLYERLLNAPQKATEAYRRTLSFSPDDDKAFTAVERMLLATESWPDLLELYRGAADHSLDMDRRKEFIYKIAEIQEGPGEDVDAAINAYLDVMDIDDRDERAVSSLDRLYAQAGRYEDLAIHLRSQIDQADEPQERNRLRCRLGKVYEENLEDLVSAVDVYEEALADEGGGIVDPLNALEKLILEPEQRQRIAEILEPVYRETDEWKKLIVILKTLVEYNDDPPSKAAVWKEISNLHYTRGNNYLLAFQSLGHAFHSDPSDRSLLEEMTALAEQIEDWDVFVSMLNEVLEDIYDLEIKREVLHLLGSTYDQRLDIPRKAIDAYKGVLEIDEADPEALAALEGLYNLVGDWDGLVAVLGAKANFSDDPLERAEILRTKASIHEDLMSSPADAIDAYRMALEADPVSPITLDALERLYEHTKDWHELVEIRRQRVDVTDDLDQRLNIMRSIAEVLEKELDDLIEAIAVWRDVLDQNGEDEKAITALDRLYTKESMHVELLENLNLQRQLAKDQSVRVELSSRIGDIQEKELSNLEGAIESLREVLLEQPTHAKAIESLTRIAQDESVRERAIEVLEPIHREAERWDELAAVIELKLEIMDDAVARLEELLGLARLHEVDRSDPATAFKVYTRALGEDPSREETMAALESIARAEGLWKALTDVYLHRADNVYDVSAEWKLLKRIGQIRETELEDISGAIEAYRRSLDSGTSDLEVLASLDRLYKAESMWSELDEILEREVELAETAEAANQFKLRLGSLRYREFGDIAGAIAVLREVIESEPENMEASAALEALLSNDDVVEELVEILTPVYEMRGEKDKIGVLFEHRLRVAASDIDKVTLYKELAIHQEDVVGDPNAAFDAYRKAFSLEPDEISLLEELERLAAVLGAWTALVESVEEIAKRDDLEPSAAVELGLKVAEWAGSNVGDPVKAEEMYRAVLEKEPGHAEALESLENLLKNLNRFDALLPVMKQRADSLYDYSAKKELYMECAAIAREELSDLAAAKEAYLEVRNLDEADIDSLDALIGIAEEEGDHPSMVEYLVARAEYTPDVFEANQFRHKAAAIYLGAQDDPEEAVTLYRQILEMDPTDQNAVEQLKALLDRLERYADLREVMLDQVTTCEDDTDRVVLLKALASLDEKRFEELDDAIGHLNDIMLITTEDKEVIASLDRLYRKTERWPDLVDLLEAETDRARDAGDVDQELTLLVQIGELLDQNLNEPDRATEFYEQVLERNPEHTRALAALARLYESKGDWEKCADVLKRAASSGTGGPEDAEVHYRLARLYEKQMGDDERALKSLSFAVQLNPGHAEANEALVRRHRESGDYQGLLQALKRQEEALADNDEKVEKLLEIAELQSNQLSDSANAVVSLESAKVLSPDNKDVLLRLSDAYIADGRQGDAIPVIEALIDAETAGGKKRSKQAAVYHGRLAKAYLAQGDQDKGLEHLEAAYKLDITNIQVLANLGQLHYALQQYDKAVKLFRALLLQRLDDSVGLTKADVYWYVGDISLKQGDPRKAKGMFRRGLDEDPNHEGCKAGLAEC